MSATSLQTWIGALTALAAGLAGILKYFKYRTKRDQLATVGAAFALTVDALASDNETKRMAGAVLLRRFFDRRTEQGAIGTPYARETIQVIAGMLREPLPSRLQKVLADGLRYAASLPHADLQRCDLKNAYLGARISDSTRIDLSFADLFEADVSGASFRFVTARGTVFFGAVAEKTVYIDADLVNADFRSASLRGAQFGGAQIGGTNFAGARDIPPQVLALLDAEQVGIAGSVVAA